MRIGMDMMLRGDAMGVQILRLQEMETNMKKWAMRWNKPMHIAGRCQ